MSILNQVSDDFRIDNYESKSGLHEINELINYFKVKIPDDYLEIIKEKTELEILVKGKKYLRLWGADGCMEMNNAYSIQKYIPDSLAIGDDECCNVLMYTEGTSGFGIYLASLSGLDVNELHYIAESLYSFLVKGEGVDVYNSIW